MTVISRRKTLLLLIVVPVASSLFMCIAKRGIAGNKVRIILHQFKKVVDIGNFPEVHSSDVHKQSERDEKSTSKFSSDFFE
jgi:hypothetical protein